MQKSDLQSKHVDSQKDKDIEIAELRITYYTVGAVAVKNMHFSDSKEYATEQDNTKKLQIVYLCIYKQTINKK